MSALDAVRNYVEQRSGRRSLDPDEIHSLDVGCPTEATLRLSDLRSLLAEVEWLTGEFQPGRWWRVLQPNGKLWAETSDGEEAREIAKEKGWQLQRQWYSERTEWRNE